MSRKTLASVIVGVLVVGFLAWFGVWTFKSPAEKPAEKSGSAGVTTQPTASSQVPEPGSEDTPENVAKPERAVRTAGGSSFRDFNIVVQKDKFIPDTVIVRLGDTVHLDLSAVDKNYDFTQRDFGFRLALPRGVKKTLEFSAAAAGRFQFFCLSCGGPDKGPTGYLEIVP